MEQKEDDICRDERPIMKIFTTQKQQRQTGFLHLRLHLLHMSDISDFIMRTSPGEQ